MTRIPTTTAPYAATGVSALVRLAVLCVGPDGDVSYWNRGAEELFGHRWEGVFGRPAAGLLPHTAGRRPGERDALEVLAGLTRSAWAGALPTADRDGGLKDVLWWAYRITEPAGPSLLVIAADARPLRDNGPRLALGDRLLPYSADGTTARGAVSVAPRLAPAADPAHAGHLGARLGSVLPRVSPGRLDRIVRQIVSLGYPAVEIDGSLLLPVLPEEYGTTVGPPPARPAAGRSARAGRPPRTAPHPELLPGPRADTTAPEPAPAAASGPSLAPGNLLDEQLALLRETGAKVGTTLDLGATARELCAVTVPRFADFAAVLVVDQLFSDAEPPKEDLYGDTVVARRVAVAHTDTTPGPWAAALPEGELIPLPADSTPRLGEPLLVPVIDAALAHDVALDLGVPGLGPLLPERSLIVVPLTARGTVLGRMCFLRHPGRRPFDAKDAATAAEVAARGAVHLDNARLHRLESRAAATLQRSMMPTSPPRIPGVRIAHHYMPGDRQAQVGGDWFDAIQLPGGRVALIVGDVMGHGLLSAAVMGQFRTSVITMAALDLPPAQLLRHLDNLAHRLGAEHLATCVYAVYDPIHRTLTLANAGHIPPVLARHDGRSELLQIPEGAPIGVGGVPFETVEVPVPDGSWLVLCTDGLVEVRGQGIDAGLAALCSNVIEPQQTPEDVCEQILNRVHSDDRRDDVALLVANFQGIPPEDVVEWRLAMDGSEVRRARALTREQLALWGLQALSDLAELLVSELVTNALRVASHEVSLRLMRVGKLLVEVSDDDHNLPQLRRADADDEKGRGLALVSNLSRRWGTSRKAVGKVVWFELPLPV
ncbi:SpoIIE family protein phosphatase [Actinacidiphila sp. bgisy167]|uniref:ATP-binding SpoIIE family protein phosphatase n=1 Tax=Actinacidiphila sp. bgisy167 TaxID=3413797 RepID=UPI003D7473E8